ncbi:MAG: heme ABC transporter permease, partial [Novosphingobium sp.]
GRLTSMLVLLFLYFGWMALSQASEASDGGQNRAPAIFGLVGAVNVPIIHYSVIWWNSQHQPPSITVGKSAMSGDFLVPLLAAMLGFTLIFAGVVLARMRAILAEQQAEARLRRKARAEVEAF